MNRKTRRIPENICHEVIPGLLVGGQAATDYLIELRVDVVFSIGSQSRNRTIETVHIGLRDDKTLNIDKELDSITDAVHQQLQSGKRVLVHCKAGINRSPSFVLAYLCKYVHMDIEAGTQLILLKRPICKFSMKDNVVRWLEKYSSS